MKKIDKDGLLLCEFQAKLFEESKTKYACSSEVFIRRFINSQISLVFDDKSLLDTNLTLQDIFDKIDEEYPPTNYGKVQFSESELYWIGYLYQYFAYTYDLRLKQVYKIIKPKELRSLYLPYHTLDCANAIERVLESKNISFDYQEIIKKGVAILKRIRGVADINTFSLSNECYEKVKNESNPVKICICDEKSKFIKNDDFIILANFSTKEKLKVKVIKIYYYNDFYELYDHHTSNIIRCMGSEVTDTQGMNKYYLHDNVSHYGVLAMEIEVIENIKHEL